MRKEIVNFQYGVINKIEEQSIPAGAMSRSHDFVTKGDHFELRRGTKIIGTEDVGIDPLRGLHIAKKSNGQSVAFIKRGRKLLFSVDIFGDFFEVGTDMFPEAAEDDEATFVDYQGLAGDQLFISSHNSSIYKIMLANPGDYADMLSLDFRGYIFGSKNCLFLVNRKGSDGSLDKTGVYRSFIDEANYTTESGESIGTGDGITFTFNETLNFKAGDAKRTAFGVTVTDSVETFTDDFNGNLIGNLGGTGTINYMTGAISVTFNSPPAGAQAITASYQWENSTNGGVADFDYSDPRVPGEGDVFRQDTGGGPALAVDTYEDVEYCFHRLKTWALSLSVDDDNADNSEFRKQVGIPTWKARCSTGEGIYYIDDTNIKDPKLRLLTLAAASERVIPKSLSEKVDLSEYRFDDAWVERYGDLVLIGCRTESSTRNNKVIVYDVTWQSFDYLDLFASFGKEWDGVFVMGDSLSGNVYEAFSGYDDDGAVIIGETETAEWDLDIPNRLKKVKKVQFEGLIQLGQIIGIYAKGDKTPYVFLGYIRGDGSYVDRTQAVTIGSLTIGRGSIGSGGQETAFHYFHELKFRVGKFLREKIMFRVETDDEGNEGIGFFSCSMIAFDQIRQKQEKIPRKYRIKRSGADQ